MTSASDLASFSSCLFNSSSPCNVSESTVDIMASNSCFRRFRLVVRLVSSSAFLVSVYVMKNAHSCETEHIPQRTLQLLLDKVEISNLDAICSTGNKLLFKVFYFRVELG